MLSILAVSVLHRAALLASVLSLSLTLVACGASNGARGDNREPDKRLGALPSPHVHGVDVNPADGLVYLATHDGLFRYDASGPARVGPQIDLMGFTIAGPDHFYASGHPGEGVELPNPVGLIESTDAGRTWTLLSRQGQSDFHSLAVSANGILGFDGTLRTTADGKRWEDLTPPASPHALTATPTGRTVLATARTGLIRSTDGGRTWAAVADAPPLMLVDWAGADTVTGVAPDGHVAVSSDAGLTWQLRAALRAQPQAIGATVADGGTPRVLVVTDNAIHESTDGGTTFTPMPGART